jgi:hypothetical protein
VTVFAGGNDTNGLVNALGCGAGGSTATSQQSFITTWITNFGNDLHQLLVGIKRKAPNAKIIIANLPNFSQIPAGLATAANDPAAGQALAAIFCRVRPQRHQPGNELRYSGCRSAV